jgi:UDP-2,4-diacetamido-2,4,6-trideoxy-beta-L-altropyranose hydrolase
MTALRVAVRADASSTLGSGHVMRCLTLAEALRDQGATVQFICRALPGHMGARIRAQGFGLALLLDHPAWDVGHDARQTRAALGTQGCDWLLVDHYGLAADWEAALRPACRWLMVIDDLADRPHQADLLLDQNLGRLPGDYDGRLPAHAWRLVGVEYALLRPQFAAARSASLARRAAGRLQTLLISMGGADPGQVSLRVLQALAGGKLPAGLQITVVLGALADSRPAVEALLPRLPWPATLRVDVADMAGLLQACDLAIGAAGSSAWERCCLGLPSVQLVLADNQAAAAAALAACGAARTLLLQGAWDMQLRGWIAEAAAHPGLLQAMSARAAAVTDGGGTARVLQAMRSVENRAS